MMQPGDRIFNPSRETDRLLGQAEQIGPHTFELCETWFKEEGRSGQRRMYGLVNLVRRYPAWQVEKAAEVARRNGLRSSKALRRMVESMAAEAGGRKAEEASRLTQEHTLIRPGGTTLLSGSTRGSGGTFDDTGFSDNDGLRVWGHRPAAAAGDLATGQLAEGDRGVSAEGGPRAPRTGR